MMVLLGRIELPTSPLPREYNLFIISYLGVVCVRICANASAFLAISRVTKWV